MCRTVQDTASLQPRLGSWQRVPFHSVKHYLQRRFKKKISLSVCCGSVHSVSAVSSLEDGCKVLQLNHLGSPTRAPQP